MQVSRSVAPGLRSVLAGPSDQIAFSGAIGFTAVALATTASTADYSTYTILLAGAGMIAAVQAGAFAEKHAIKRVHQIVDDQRFLRSVGLRALGSFVPLYVVANIFSLAEDLTSLVLVASVVPLSIHQTWRGAGQTASGSLSVFAGDAFLFIVAAVNIALALLLSEAASSIFVAAIWVSSLTLAALFDYVQSASLSSSSPVTSPKPPEQNRKETGYFAIEGALTHATPQAFPLVLGASGVLLAAAEFRSAFLIVGPVAAAAAGLRQIIVPKAAGRAEADSSALRQVGLAVVATVFVVVGLAIAVHALGLARLFPALPTTSTELALLVFVIGLARALSAGSVVATASLRVHGTAQSFVLLRIFTATTSVLFLTVGVFLGGTLGAAVGLVVASFLGLIANASMLRYSIDESPTKRLRLVS